MPTATKAPPTATAVPPTPTAKAPRVGGNLVYAMDVEPPTLDQQASVSANMQTRAHNVGGEVEITSEPGHGTTVLAWVPYIVD